MEQIYTQILRELGSLAKLIPQETLKSFTKDISNQKLPLKRCGKVRELIILKPDDQQHTRIYTDQGKTRMLVLRPTLQQIETVVGACGSKLIKLMIRSVQITSLDLSGVRGLRDLNLAKSGQLATLDGLKYLTCLEKLNLSFTEVQGALDLDPLCELKELRIQKTGINQIQLTKFLTGLTYFDASESKLEDIAFLENLPDLTFLNLEKTAISSVACNGSFPKLETLILTGTSISSLDGFPLPVYLKSLSIDSSEITTVPEGIRTLTELEYLDLGGLELEIIPSWFPDHCIMKKGNAVNFHGTRIANERVEYLRCSQEEIQESLRMFCMQNQSEYKVILLGDAEAGKSLTLHRLMNDDTCDFEDVENDDADDKIYAPADFNPDSTPGIKIKDKEFDLSRYDLGDDQIRVHFWDFGGQEVLHSAHSVFLTDKTLYVILLNARNDTQDERARYWLRFIGNLKSKNCPVILVINKLDQNPNASLDSYSVKRKYGMICDILKISALKYNRRKFANKLTSVILSRLIKFDDLKVSFPTRYNALREKLAEMEAAHITKREIEEFCADCDSNSDDDSSPESMEAKYRFLLRKINHLGIGFNRETATTTDYYLILKPEWFTNAVYTIIYNKHSEVQNGIISRKDVLELLEPPYYLREKIKQVDPSQKYCHDTVRYVLEMMDAVELAFQLDDKQELYFIPMLCTRETPEFVREYVEDPHALCFRYDYGVLTKPMVSCLIAKLYKEANRREVWMTGARLHWDIDKCSVVLIAEDGVLELYMRSDGKDSNEQDRLDDLIKAIDKINSDEGWGTPQKQIGFRHNGLVEFFDYDMLNDSQAHKMQLVYSRIRQELVYIEDILHYSERSDDRLRDRLLRDIITICNQMQNDHHYFNCKEDVRNTYLRNSLRNKGYKVYDQTEQGLGGGETDAGRPDLKIHTEADNPMTLLEAQILHGADENARENWLGHLKRLLVNYNTEGYPFLFLVNYVEDTSDHFGTICDSFFQYMQDNMPKPYKLESFEPDRVHINGDEPYHYIKKTECIYNTKSTSTRVYHIFVRFWDRTEPAANGETAGLESITEA